MPGWRGPGFPPGGFSLNRTSPLARGLVHWGVPGVGRYDVVPDMSGCRQGGNVIGSPTWTFDATFGRVFDVDLEEGWDTGHVPDGTALTFAYWYCPDNAGANYQWSGKQDSDRWYLGLHGGGVLALGVGDTYNTSLGASGASTGEWALIVGVADGSTAKGYCNGVYIGQISYSFAGAGSTSMVVGWNREASRGNYGLMGDGYLWNRALSLEEIKSLYDDPWQLYDVPMGYVPESAGGTTHHGSATLAGVGALSADGRRVVHVGADLAGAGALAAVARAVRHASVTVAGSGSLTAQGRVIRHGAAALAGAGALAGQARLMAHGSATLAGAGTLTANGIRRRHGSAMLAGVGTLDAQARRIAHAAAVLGGIGNLLAVARLVAHGSATLAGVGSLSAALTQVIDALTPDERTYTVAAEDRTFDVPSENRTLSVG